MQAAGFHRFNLVGTGLKYRFILMTSQRVVPNTNASSDEFDAAYTSLKVDGEDGEQHWFMPVDAFFVVKTRY
jgi:hypothetical protein